MSMFDQLLLSYAHASSAARRQDIEAQLWSTYGHEAAVLVLDMSGFSQLTHRYGIIHYLSMVQRMHIVAQPIIERYHGQVVKFEADNYYARFAQVHDAIRAAIGINLAMDGMNHMTPDEFDVRVACGIDFGRFLLIEEHDFFGDPVNKACKLGEDLSAPGEILVTNNAMQHIDPSAGIRSKPVEFSIAGIALTAHQILY